MDKALQTMVDNMPEKTGEYLDAWKAILNTKQFKKHADTVKFLKKEDKVTHGFANTIVSLFRKDNEGPADLVADQYKGKESLLPIYDSILKMVTAFGSDVVVVPKKTSVSIIRKKQFALIKPATKTRKDLGIKNNDKPITESLESFGPFSTMRTHRVRLSETKEVDQELKSWLQEAYTKAE
ncbi:MAG: hypothetical protein ACI86M_001876 [Saprospiraceae bacterium]|jgi:hypothetical protein